MASSDGAVKESQIRKYDFPTEPIKRISISDSKADEYVSSGTPVIFTDSNLVSPAIAKWNLDYLASNLGEGNYSVYESKDHRFKYFDEKKAKVHKQFQNPMKRVEMKFQDFVTKIRAAKPDDSPRLYLQQALNDGVGKQIVVDFLQFNWAWVTNYQKSNKWGPLTSNLLLISQEGNITPVHYDEQENFFTQVTGCKRVILFAPDQFENLYPYPVGHPHDRQSQINFEKPDYDRFPNFKNAKGYEAVLEPGEVLYLPMYWWHQFESLIDGGITTSVTFWYKAAEAEKDVKYPLKPTHKVAMMRNIEKMLLSALNSEDEMYPFMRNLVLGRYTEDAEVNQFQS